MNGQSFQAFIFVPAVGCDICHRESFYPPGLVWSGKSTDPIPPTLKLVRQEDNTHYAQPTFTIEGCATQEEAVQMAIANGWRFASPDRIICPNCQALIAEIAGNPQLWERKP